MSRLKKAMKNIDRTIPEAGFAVVAVVAVAVFIVGNILLVVVGTGLLWLIYGIVSQKTTWLLILPILLSIMAMHQNSIASKYRRYLLVYSLAARNEKARLVDESRGTIKEPILDSRYLDSYSSKIVESFNPKIKTRSKTRVSSESELQEFRYEHSFLSSGYSGLRVLSGVKEIEPIQIEATLSWNKAKESASSLYSYAAISIPVIALISFISFIIGNFNSIF